MPPNAREALREVQLDVDEGADLLDGEARRHRARHHRIRCARTSRIRSVAYQVSGEYAMLKAAAERGWLDEPRAALEALLAIKPRGRRTHHHLLRQGSRALARRRPDDDLDSDTQLHQCTRIRTHYSRARSEVMPGGVSSPVRAFRSVGGTPRFMIEAPTAPTSGMPMATATWTTCSPGAR
jgi:hypothetical protein